MWKEQIQIGKREYNAKPFNCKYNNKCEKYVFSREVERKVGKFDEE
jgi:hypothetical protein